jgi:outer membrane protein TolC
MKTFVGIQSSLGALLLASSALAQAPAPAPAPAPAAPVAAPVAPEAPVGKITTVLEERLSTMRKGSGLTADEVARRSIANSHQIAAKREAVTGTEHSIDQAGKSFYPQLTLSARYTRLSEIEPPALAPGVVLPLFFNNYSLQATLNIPLSDYLLRMSKAVSGATHARNAAEIDERATRLAVARDARVAYYQWINAQGVHLVAEQSLAQAQGHLNDVKNAFQAGLVSKADVLRAESQAMSAELFVERAASGVGITTERLRVLMRDPPSKNYEVGENILADLPKLPNVTTLNAAYAEALGQRLELRALGETEAALRDQARLQRGAGYPRLDAQGNVTYQNPNQRYFPPDDRFKATWDASVVLSWTPSAIFGAEAGAAATESKAGELAAQRGALRDALRLEVSQALSALRESEFAIGVTHQALAAAEEGYRVRRELFRSGRATLVEVTDAETELTRARLQAVDAHINLRIARVQLLHVLGRDVTGSG